MQTTLISSPHVELISTLTELYTILDTLGAIGDRTVRLPLYEHGAINRDAARAADYDVECIDLMTALPYLDTEPHDIWLEILPSTFPVTYLGQDFDEGYFKSRREMLHDELMPSHALRLSWSEGGQGIDYIYDTKTKLLSPWKPFENPDKVDDYYHVPGAAPRQVLEPLISACQRLEYLGKPDGLDFNYALFSESGGHPPRDWPDDDKRKWQAQYDIWRAVRKLKDMYLECGWDVDAVQQKGFRRQEFLDRREHYWIEVVQPLIDREA